MQPVRDYPASSPPAIVVVRHYQPDRARVAAALVKLLLWRPRRQEEERHGRSDSE